MNRVKQASRLGVLPVVLIVVGIVLVSIAPALKANVVLTLQLGAVYVLFAVATNLLLGQTGLLSFGQAVFFGTGAYVAALGLTTLHWPLWFAMLAAIVIPAILSMVIGALALRTRKFYFGLITLAFSQLFATLSRQLYDLTGGDTGIFGLDLPRWLIRPADGLRLTVFVVIVCVVLLWLITQSPFGQTLSAIKENRQRAQALGINVRRQEWIAFVIAGLFTGVAGLLFAVGQQAAYPSLLDWQTSGIPLFMSLIGGMNAFWGPIVGAIVFHFGRQALVTYTSHWQLFFGLLIIVIVLFAPNGIAGLVDTIRRRIRRGRRPRPERAQNQKQPSKQGVDA